MKRVLFPILLLCFATLLNAEDKAADKRFIEVVGSAEKDVLADQFVLSICLREYYNASENGKKVPIASIEQEFLETTRKIGVTPTEINTVNLGDYWSASDKREKDYLISKTLNIKFNDIEKMNQLLKEINTQSVNYMRIIELSNKDILQYRKEVRIAALQAAKEKASYLLESLNEKLGEVISISEMNSPEYRMYQSQRMSNTMLSDHASGADSIENLRKIKVAYEIKVRFEIKRTN